LVIKAKIDDMHTIFLLKKSIKSNIIKTILEYLPIVALESLKKWKIAVTSVRQGYKFIEDKQDYRTGSEITYRERKVSIKIGKSKDNYNKDEKPICVTTLA